jgi:hydrogenase maturation protease
MRIVVLGVGNILLSDEGVGVRAIEALLEGYLLPAGVEVIDGGTSGMELLEDLSSVDLLIVADAVKAGKPPASIIRIAGADVPVFFRAKISPHQVGLSDVLADLEFMGEPPRETVIIGVQPVSMETRMELTPEVTARLDEVVGMIVAELKSHGVIAQPRAEVRAH